MDDVAPESHSTRTPEDREPSTPDADLSSHRLPPLPSPSVNDLAALAGNSEATIIAPSPVRHVTGSLTPGKAEEQSSDATVIAFAADSDRNAATFVSITPTDASRFPASPAGPIQDRLHPTSGAILLEVGTLLGGRYEILQLLGEGGMGAVYKAADREVDRVIALKVIRPEMASSAEILARFKQELLLSSRVTHRNVIRIYDLGEAQGVKFITMEFVEGENLHQILKKRLKLGVSEAVDIMEQVASGLAAAHREGIIHRDLKPANIMLDKNGRVVLMDFGLARTFSGDGMTQTGTMLGTLEYMSPEQAQGMDVKASSDVFTVGLILYELLAGTTPFYAESAIASLLLRTQQRAAPLINVDKSIPGTLSNIVVKCLEKDPAKRYQSAEHLDSDLLAWQGVGGRTKVTAPSTRLRVDNVRRLPWLPIGAGVLVFALAAGSIWFVMNKRQATKLAAHGPVSVLIGDFANHTGDSVLDNTLEPMLGVAMEGASFINVYSRGDARKLAKKLPNPTDVLDEQSSRLVAITQGINTVITGDITLRGEQYDISAIALDTQSGNVLAKAEVSVTDKQQILSELPKLAVPIRKAMGDATPEQLQFKNVSGGFTAASLEAVHQDALGVDQQFAGKFQEAFNSFQKSAEIDPHFARAYTGMAAMAQNLGRPGDALKFMKLAMANADRMTERERLRNQGLYYRTTGEWQNCVQQYTQLVTLYPADRVGQNNLAICYLQLRDAPKALLAAQHAVEIVPRGAGQRLTLAFISAFAGDFSASEKEARTALEISPTAAQGSFVLAEAQLGQGQIDQAAASYHQLEKYGALGTSTSTDGLADLAAYQGKYGEAARLLKEGIAADTAAKMTDNAARKYVALGNIEELEGHHAPALESIGKALAISQAIQIQFLAAGVSVDAGDVTRAQKLATGLSAQSSSEPQAYGKIIQGMIALRRGDAQEAVTQMTAANALLDTWIGRYYAGRAYLDAGAFPEAIGEFERCLKRRGESIELFDDNVPTYSYLPAVYYYRGKAEESAKNNDYISSYRSYISIRGQSTEDPLVPILRSRIGS